MEKQIYIKLFKSKLYKNCVNIEEVSINDLAMVNYYLDNNLFSEAEAIINEIVHRSWQYPKQII